MTIASERASLVRALSTVVVLDRRKTARRFLQGLSTEELRYIASYMGACLLESETQSRPVSRCQLAWDILQYQCWTSPPERISGDLEHKMILVLEYLNSCRSVATLRVPAGSA